LETAVAISLVVIAAAIVVSYWKGISFSIIASIACVVVYMIMIATDTISSMAFAPRDLTDPGRLYTILTSMFAHSELNMWHLIYNVLVLIMIGLAFEQKIATRQFVLLYLLSGLVGTLTFAAIRWNDPAAVVGASGAIMGILGGFARLYPRERMSMFVGFVPLPPMPIWVIAVILIGLQFLFVGTNIAIESHLGGMLAGLLLAPLIVRMRKTKRGKRRISLVAISKLAVTPELKSILNRIMKEEVAEVRGAWIEHFLVRARCPRCGARIRIEDDSVICERGHVV